MHISTEIIEGCKKQDAKSQELLYRQYYKPMYSLCKNFFSDQHDIITSLNNGMLKVFKNIEQYDESKGTLFNWVYTIVRHAAISHFKQQKVNLTYELNDRLKDTWESNPFIHLEWKDIYVYLDQLPKTTRTVCALFYLQGFAINEIASALEIKEGTVKWHLNESRTKLKALFNQEKVQIRG